MPRFSSGSCPTWLSVPVLAFAGAAEETARTCGPAAATSRAGTTRQVALPPVQSAAVGGAVTALPSQSTWWAPAEAGRHSAAKAVAAAHAMRARPNDMRPLLPIDRPPSRGTTVLDTRSVARDPRSHGHAEAEYFPAGEEALLIFRAADTIAPAARRVGASWSRCTSTCPATG